MDRKTTILISLLLLWGLIIVYRVSTHEEPRRAPLKHVQGQTVDPKESVRQYRSEFIVRLDLLEPGDGVALKNPKNIFAPLRSHLPPPPPPPKPPEPPPPPPPPTPEELAIERARRELGQFRYLGYMNKGPGMDQAFLARGEELFIVNQGDTVSGSILLKEVTSGYVTLQEIHTLIEMTLTISGT